MKVAAVKSPKYGEERRSIMEDLAVATGARYFRTMLGEDVKSVTINDLGTCKSVEISKYGTIVVGGGGNHSELTSRIEDLKQQVKDAETLPDAESIQERVTRLSSGVAIIRVGAATEIEMIEKKHRIEDALEAVRSAQQEGVVPGGGLTLYRLSKTIVDDCRNLEMTDEQRFAAEIFLDVLQSPIRTMAFNAGYSYEDVDKVICNESDDVGFDFLSGNSVDMYNKGIIDPAKVTRHALRNAVSAAGTLLTTNFAIIEHDE